MEHGRWKSFSSARIYRWHESLWRDFTGRLRGEVGQRQPAGGPDRPHCGHSEAVETAPNRTFPGVMVAPQTGPQGGGRFVPFADLVQHCSSSEPDIPRDASGLLITDREASLTQ